MIDQALAHYRITASLGAGGMGEVFRATDTRLGREVALKVLSSELAGDPQRIERFFREARAVAALNHPHIVTLYSVEESGGVHFLTMELVQGQTLDHLIPVGGMPVRQIVDTAIALADAMAAAHAKGIVHRDLKPANVMVGEDGRVKVLDFGLAKVAAPEAEGPANPLSTEMHTREGVVMGTVPYMSPEQVEGRALDARTDIFSLGVMLHELATGSRPFRGSSTAALLSAILRDPPPPLGAARPDLPEPLARLIGRCLEKDREQRAQAAREIKDELVALRQKLDSGGVPATSSLDAPVSGFGGRPALAVLPFENRSGDPEQDYFADGLAEDLITRLSLWRSFPVISRNSSFAFKGRRLDVKQVAAELGVRYVVEGSVRKAGNRVRIAAQLVDGATGQQVWARSYDRELTDVFAVQDEISEAIAVPLTSDLQRAEHARFQRRAPESLEAWGLYQRAVPLVHRFTREDFTEARSLLERALALEPSLSTAAARLAELGVWEMVNGWTDDPDRTLQEAVALAHRAVASDPQDADAQAVLAFGLLTAGDSAGALEASRRSVDLNPSLPFGLAFLGYLTHMIGHPPEESIELVRRAMRLSPHDPMEWIFYDALGGAYWNAGRYEEGLGVSRRLIALLPSYYFGYVWAALNAVGLDRLDEARELVRQGRKVQPGLSMGLLRRGLGAMAADVDRRMAATLGQAGLD